MYLSEIEIVGFKSFAQKTKLKFAQGLSAVVGPNGCGKTNVVDAIRWVLGEKKASTLRSDVMENVIFNGTRDRKPLSLAEVSITFDNSTKVLPSDYNEVVVTRRLFRNGESEYLMNKAHCRLKDILDLFMDTGIGADTYSVIELKMVDAILSGKVDDRRAMFEEAAGIKKYKARRKESLKKLESVKQDMERIQDILQEVRKNVNSLSRQAAKTKKYNQYLTELKSLEIELFAREYLHFKILKTKIEENKKEVSSKIIKFEIALSDNEKEIAKQKETLLAIENDLSKTIENEKQLLNEIANLKQSIAVNSEKIVSFDKTKDRINNEINDSEKSLLIRNNDLKIIVIELESKQSELNESKSRINNLSSLRNEARVKVQEIESKSVLINNEIITFKNKIDSLNNLINRSKEKKAGIERKIQQLAEEKYRYHKQEEELLADKKSNDKQLPELKSELDESESNLKLANEQRITLESEIDKVKQIISEKRNIVGGKKASLDFLNSLVDNSEAAKFLSNSQNWQVEGEKIILGEAIGTDDEYRLAVIAALGDIAHSFIAVDMNSAFDGLNSLKSKSKGKSGFIALSNIPEISAPGQHPNQEGVIGWMSEVVRVDDKIRSLLRGILGKTLLVKDYDTAAKILKEGVAESCVTVDGLFLNAYGYIHGGSVSHKEGQWVGKKERILSISKEINTLNLEITNSESNLKDLVSELSGIDIQSIQREIKSIEFKIQENRKRANQFETKLESLSNNLNFVEENSLRHQDELQELTSDDSNLHEEIQNINNLLKSKYSEVEIINSELNDARNFLQEKQEIFRIAELTGVTLESNIKSLQNDKIRISSEINQFENKISSKNKELLDLDSQKDDLIFGLEENSSKMIISEQSLENTKTKREVLTSNKKAASDTYEQANSEFNITRKEFDKIKENLHQVEVQEVEVNSNIQNILERALEQYETDITTVYLEENPEFDIKSSKNLIHDLREKLSQLGNVNFMALEEYDIQNERLEFYEKQMNDLTESERLLRETIEEINATAERNFRETFDSIRSNFKMLFKKLFGEDGESDIHLESADLLESDIVITAKPPNKRPHSIEMLSGGEKTLTAIALLFAIYLVKPSPFCILDEVDAPLDDANIDKFVGLIKDFSLDTQFLIVTHNKKTMEAADTLYGVTMQEEGVSKVVAVKISSDAA
jgi:chromosome segregation protein